MRVDVRPVRAREKHGESVLQLTVGAASFLNVPLVDRVEALDLVDPARYKAVDVLCEVPRVLRGGGLSVTFW